MSPAVVEEIVSLIMSMGLEVACTMMKAYNEEQESKNVSLPTCYVCGTPNCAQCLLCVRQPAPGKAFFPFLETHEPPESSQPIINDQVLACNLCFQMLHYQWKNYEDNRIPLVKRLYWLKRDDGLPYSGVEMGMQTEYASQFLGLTPDPSITEDRVSISGPSRSHLSGLQSSKQVASNLANSLVKKSNSKHISVAHPHPEVVPQISLETSTCVTSAVSPCPSIALPNKVEHIYDQRPLSSEPQEEALDLSVDRTPKTVASVSSEVLDLSMPDKNASTEVCYVCGDHYSRGTLFSMSARELTAHRPYFPSLVYHARPSKSHPMESSGCVQSCPSCYTSLLTQYAFFNSKGIDHKNRLYYLGKFPAPLENSILCYDCHKLVLFADAKVVFITNSESKFFSPDVGRRLSAVECPQLLQKAAKAVCCNCPSSQSTDGSLSDGSNETIEVCDTSSPEPKRQKTTAAACEGSAPSRPQSNGGHLRSSPALSTVLEVPDGLTVSCYLCHQNHSKLNMHWVSMRNDSANGDGIYFPFIKNIHRIKSSIISDDGKVLVCSYCHVHLKRQWNDFESRNVAMERRVFSCRPPSVGSASPRLTPNVSPPRSSPDPLCPDENSQHLQKSSPFAKNSPTETYLNLKELEIELSKNPKSNYALPSISSQNPLNISVKCYLCGFPSERGETYAISSFKSGALDMYFPFLDAHSSLHENAYSCNGSFLICTFCFHTLVQQWQRFEKKKVEPLGRFYNTYSFKCYVCSLKTYRKRLRKISVEKFPFLRTHLRPHDALIIENGLAVAVCTDCHTRMCDQFNDMEKTGVPVDKREYNWIKKPAPPQFPLQMGAVTPPSAPSIEGGGALPTSSSEGTTVKASAGNKILAKEATMDRNVSNCKREVARLRQQEKHRRRSVEQREMAKRSNAARQREARAKLTLERRLEIVRNNAEQHRVARERVNLGQNIRNYNSAFTFASFGANLRPPPGRGPYCFDLQSQTYHYASNLQNHATELTANYSQMQLSASQRRRHGVWAVVLSAADKCVRRWMRECVCVVPRIAQCVQCWATPGHAHHNTAVSRTQLTANSRANEVEISHPGCGQDGTETTLALRRSARAITLYVPAPCRQDNEEVSLRRVSPAFATACVSISPSTGAAFVSSICTVSAAGSRTITAAVTSAASVRSSVKRSYSPDAAPPHPGGRPNSKQRC
ncbi:Multihem cytochrome [Trinorchestia longiramus]|nr:Multihem cytochrome [Trinorchestia longiramus]